MDEQKVVPLHGTRLQTSGPGPDKEVIKALRRLLVAAKAGEIRALAYAWVLPNNHLRNGTTNFDGPLSWALLSAVTLLQGDMVACVNEGDSEVELDPEPPEDESELEDPRDSRTEEREPDDVWHPDGIADPVPRDGDGDLNG